MKLVATHIDDHFMGYLSVQELTKLKNKCYKSASEKQRKIKADHMIYAHYDYDQDNNITKAWFYEGLPMSDNEFERVSCLKHCYIGVIHKHP